MPRTTTSALAQSPPRTVRMWIHAVGDSTYRISSSDDSGEFLDAYYGVPDFDDRLLRGCAGFGQRRRRRQHRYPALRQARDRDRGRSAIQTAIHSAASRSLRTAMPGVPPPRAPPTAPTGSPGSGPATISSSSSRRKGPSSTAVRWSMAPSACLGLTRRSSRWATATRPASTSSWFAGGRSAGASPSPGQPPSKP